MHVPDGFFDAPTSIGTGVLAAAAVGISLKGARRELDERTTPLAGLTAAFVFAVQMLNFPVAAGTSGHLLGGTLAAILVGPYTGVLCVAIVLAVQALLFADGGLTAIGINILLVSIVPVVVGYVVFRGLLRVAPRRRLSLPTASFIAAFLSVPLAAGVFVGLYALGGTATVPLGLLAGAMVGVHALIAIGEGIITAVVISAVVAARPDLVYAARDFLPGPKLHNAPAGSAASAGSNAHTSGDSS